MDESAYHEAGHVVVAILLGARVSHATIEPDRDDGPQRHGDVRVLWPRTTADERSLAERLVLTALAGPVAEMIYTGEPYHPGFVAEWADDWQQALAAAAALVKDERRRLNWLETQVRRVYELLDQRHWPAIAALADKLAAHETLEEEQITAALEPWLDPPG
jgi:ATP-dependent Zn protease